MLQRPAEKGHSSSEEAACMGTSTTQYPSRRNRRGKSREACVWGGACACEVFIESLSYLKVQAGLARNPRTNIARRERIPHLTFKHKSTHYAAVYA